MILKKIEDVGIIPVIQLDNVDDSERMAKALLDGDVDVAEVTFRANGADKVIKRIAKEYPNMLIGAGTVLTIEQAERAIDAGAKFIVSPGLSEDVISYSIKNDIPVFPGCLTPTEIQKAISLGLNILKFFPCETFGGLNAIKALSGPFPGVRFIPTGGIRLDNLHEYIATPSILACGGTFMATTKILREQNWTTVTEKCKEAREIIIQTRRSK